MKHLMIRPIMPRITPEITENPLILVNGIVLLALTVLTAVFISLYASNVYKGNKKKAVLFFTVIAALTALSLFCFFGCAATTVKGIIFCLLLAFSSYEDIKTRECENYVHLMIVIAAFIGTDMSALPGMLLSALIIGGIMLATGGAGQHRRRGYKAFRRVCVYARHSTRNDRADDRADTCSHYQFHKEQKEKTRGISFNPLPCRRVYDGIFYVETGG